jgi:tight adherence protein C
MILTIIFSALSLVVGISFVVLLLTSGEFDSYIAPLDKETFKFTEIYGVGFKLLKILKIELKGKEANQIRESVTILYGERYSDYYLQVMYAQKISIIYMCFAIFSGISALAEGTDKILLFFVGLVMCGAMYYYFSTLPASRIKQRSADILSEFPHAVSTIALLVNSGMTLREAWREVSLSDETALYVQMRKVNDDMDNGIAEIDALYNFAERCVSPEIKKFTSFIVQGLEKGSKDLAYALQNQTDEMWQLKKQNTLKQGELASSKLLIPLLVMFGGVLVMIIGPIMTNLGL